MVGHFLPNGRNVIWDLPTRPTTDAYRNYSFDGPHDGIYLFGQNIFPTLPFTITPVTRRNLTGGAEEFLLGVLSVLLIALLSEVVQAILMCTRRARQPGRKGVKMAFLIDEFYHFRNVWNHLFGKVIRKGRSGHDPERRRRVLSSVTILLIALGLMAADVFAVYLTQPVDFFSENYQYNVRGVTPTFVNAGLGRFVNRLSAERPCVTPTFVQEGQERLYTISACTTIDFERNLPDGENFTGIITVSSFFHKGGSDHNITFGDNRFSIKSRTIIYVSEGPAWRILYDVVETEDFELTKFLHELFITNVMEVSCNRPNESGSKPRFVNTWCEEILELRKNVSQEIVEENVVLWSRRDGDDEQQVIKGVKTSYNVTLERGWESVDNGKAPLTSVSLLDEVEGAGMYSNITNEVFEDNLDGLLQEEGRVAGLLILSIAFLVFAILLMLLRFFLRPISLGSMAWEARVQMSDTDSEAAKEEMAPQTSSVGISSSTSLNFEQNMVPHSPLDSLEPQDRGRDGIHADAVVGDYHC